MANTTLPIDTVSGGSAPSQRSTASLGATIDQWRKNDGKADQLILRVGGEAIDPITPLGDAIAIAVGGRKEATYEYFASKCPTSLTIDVAVESKTPSASLVFVLDGREQPSLADEDFKSWLKDTLNSLGQIRIYDNPSSERTHTTYFGKKPECDKGRKS